MKSKKKTKRNAGFDTGINNLSYLNLPFSKFPSYTVPFPYFKTPFFSARKWKIEVWLSKRSKNHTIRKNKNNKLNQEYRSIVPFHDDYHLRILLYIHLHSPIYKHPFRVASLEQSHPHNDLHRYVSTFLFHSYIYTWSNRDVT